jgi:hypothetical protein
MKLALCGASGSGKDFLTTGLVKGMGFVRASFSDQLKKISKQIYPWIEADYPAVVKEQPLNIVTDFGHTVTHTPRDIWIGLNALRQFDPHLFVRMLDNEVSEMVNFGIDVVITDVRTDVEYEYIRDNGYTLVFIDPSRTIYKPNDFDKYALSLESKADVVFYNMFNGTDEFVSLIYQLKQKEA